jgi:ubiquinone biosynthesis protein UbiJ
LLSTDALSGWFERTLAGHIERALADSPRARELCSALAGRSLQIEVTGTGIRTLVSATDNSLRLSRSSGTADVTISGAPLALLAAAAGDPQQLLADGRLQLGGDELIARQFLVLAPLLNPGLEAGLARFMGRIPAHLGARGLRSIQRWGRAAGRSLLDNSADYLAHESRDLVPRAEAESFLGGVTALRASVNQAEARLAQLDARLAQLRNGSA